MENENPSAVECVPAVERTAERKERPRKIGTPLVARRQLAHLVAGAWATLRPYRDRHAQRPACGCTRQRSDRLAVVTCATRRNRGRRCLYPEVWSWMRGERRIQHKQSGYTDD